jgi:hypothetical protein
MQPRSMKLHAVSSGLYGSGKSLITTSDKKFNLERLMSWIMLI